MSKFQLFYVIMICLILPVYAIQKVICHCLTNNCNNCDFYVIIVTFYVIILTVNVVLMMFFRLVS